VSALWELKEARRIVARQNLDGSWRYPGAQARIRSQENYDQIETFRQVAILVEMFGFAREHPALARAAEYLFSCQTREGDFRGIYGHQYATTYVGAIMELLIKAGYADDPRVAKGFAWLLSARQDDGGWAVPLRTARVPYSESVDVDRYPTPIVPVGSGSVRDDGRPAMDRGRAPAADGDGLCPRGHPIALAGGFLEDGALDPAGR
jgi:hypothetical protein